MSGQAPPTPVLLGRYAITAKIADGGMATLYLGVGRTGDGKEELVALKVIKEGLSGDEVYEAMFLDEARILSLLGHPNVIHTHEYGITKGGHPFIAMELLLGRTLADAWDDHANESGHMPLALGAWICARVAEGLHSAHALRDDEGALLQVIHRDVNPSNVFLTYDGQVKLIDFGLSRARRRSAKTGDGIVKGKIPYLAPEQATHGPIDRRIDVFALGATLWEVCTGRRLFKRETDAETLQAVRDANIPDVQSLRPEVPAALARIVHRALAISPDERFGTAAELQRELDAFVDAKVDRKAELADYLEKRFPGERARQLEWVKAASAPRKPMATLAPPVPIGLDMADGARGGTLGPHTKLPESAITGAFPASSGATPDEPMPRFSASPAKRVAVALAIVAAVGLLVALALR